MSKPEPNPNPTPPPSTVDIEAAYPCIGVCMADPESGLCQGCGRPLAEAQPPEPNGWVDSA